MFKHISIICVLLFSLEISIASKCCKITNRNISKFKLIRRHSRSTEFILSEKTFSTVRQCQEFAILKNALAFNYYPLDISINSTKIKININQHNCQVIGCPETNVAHTIVAHDKFSYYSLYSRNIIPVNNSVKCLPRIGVFVTPKNFENYSNAQLECSKFYGKLAHIVSAERSVGLSKFIGDTPTFVGLSNQGKQRLWKNEFDEPLSCFEYRAWANREPSSRGCVTLTAFSPKSSSTVLPLWKVVRCSQLLPFICEILPNSSSTLKNK